MVDERFAIQGRKKKKKIVTQKKPFTSVCRSTKAHYCALNRKKLLLIFEK